MSVERSRVFAVVMAGGVGSRFWPRSRRRLPKQFLPIVSRRTMLEETCRRLRGIVPAENLLVVAGREHAAHVRRVLPGLPRGNLLLEPVGRGTAACICLAALHLQRRTADPLLLVVPADHAIDGARAFRQTVRLALATAREKDCLVTIGITPTAPETGYGYIHAGPEV